MSPSNLTGDGETCPVTSIVPRYVMYCTTHGTSDHSGLGEYAGCRWERRQVETVGYPAALNDGAPKGRLRRERLSPLPPRETFCVTHQARGVHYNGDAPCTWQEMTGPPKGTPNRRVIQRALFLLDDFSGEDCRVVLKRLLDTAPLPASTAIAERWERSIEPRRERLRGQIE